MYVAIIAPAGRYVYSNAESLRVQAPAGRHVCRFRCQIWKPTF